MTNEELLQRLLELTEKQQQNIDALNNHISKLEEFIESQGRTIDTLVSMSRPIIIHGNNNGNINSGSGTQHANEFGCKHAKTITEGTHTQNFNTGSNA